MDGGMNGEGYNKDPTGEIASSKRLSFEEKLLPFNMNRFTLNDYLNYIKEKEEQNVCNSKIQKN